MEALSRGASHVTLVDIDQKHMDVARKNIAYIGEADNAAFIRGDSATPPPARVPCNLVFLDPPYGAGLVEKSLKGLISGGWLTEEAIIVIETGRTEDVTLPESLTELEDRIYGNSRIRIVEYKKAQ
jgi:16S rRNA (guanine966-N2)-methyltransferase